MTAAVLLLGVLALAAALPHSVPHRRREAPTVTRRAMNDQAAALDPADLPPWQYPGTARDADQRHAGLWPRHRHRARNRRRRVSLRARRTNP